VVFRLDVAEQVDAPKVQISITGDRSKSLLCGLISASAFQAKKFFRLPVDRSHPYQTSRKLAHPSFKMDESHKPHRPPHSGTKADKKKAKKNGTSVKKGSNPKAFSMQSSRRAEKAARRTSQVY